MTAASGTENKSNVLSDGGRNFPEPPSEEAPGIGKFIVRESTQRGRQIQPELDHRIHSTSQLMYLKCLVSRAHTYWLKGSQNVHYIVLLEVGRSGHSVPSCIFQVL